MPTKKKQSELPLSVDATAPAASPAAPPQPSTNDSAVESSFEDAIERLSEIVEQLESEGLPLDASLKLFEEGVRLARKSQARLETAERRVQELLSFDENGKPIVDELDPE